MGTIPRTLAEYRRFWAESAPHGVPYGFCWCGCGEKTTISRYNRPHLGHIEGEPVRYVRGHQKPKPTYVEEDRGFATPCWIWQGNIGSVGYGWKWLGAKRQVLAHRWMYERERGPIPEGMQPDHLCRVRACVNPYHLEIVTPAENVRRGRSAKLDEQAVAVIRRMSEDGISQMRIAAEFGVHQSNVSLIVNGKAWKVG